MQLLSGVRFAEKSELLRQSTVLPPPDCATQGGQMHGLEVTAGKIIQFLEPRIRSFGGS